MGIDIAGAAAGVAAFAVTAAYHIPRNNALDRVDAAWWQQAVNFMLAR